MNVLLFGATGMVGPAHRPAVDNAGCSARTALANRARS